MMDSRERLKVIIQEQFWLLKSLKAINELSFTNGNISILAVREGSVNQL